MCVAAAAVSVFLPWQTVVGDDTGAIAGTSLGEGRIVFIVCLVTIGLIQVHWRPAWIGAGFAAATAIRELFDGETDPAWGLAITVAASVVAAVLLVWDIFANVGKASDEPGGRGLSGPLGRRGR